MKTLNVTILLFATLLTLAACGKKDSNVNTTDGNAAALDLPAECQAPTDYASASNWNLYRGAGCTPYRWGRNNQIGRSGCPSGYFAACGTGVGLVCMPETIYRSNEIAWFDYHRGFRRFHFCGYEAYGQPNGTCGLRANAASVGRSCIVGQLNSCGQGQCRPVARRSSIGVCTR